MLFRFYKDFDFAKERIRIIKHFDSGLPIYGLYGGPLDDYENAKSQLAESMENIWMFKSKKSPGWKWLHTDIMQKEWFRDYGHKLDFDYMFSYEYDLLTVNSLFNIYPKFDQNTLILSAVDLLKNVEDTWSWTSKEPSKTKFAEFTKYMHLKYGMNQQKHVCLGPGPMLPRKFIEKFAATEDIELMHEEVTYPAYAEVFGFKLADHGMHPGFASENTEDEYFFNCNNNQPKMSDVFAEMSIPNGRRSFHPIKTQIILEDVLKHLNLS